MFVATKASALKKNAENNFQSVTFQKRAKKPIPIPKSVEESTISERPQKKNEIPDMKKLRYEIIKYGTSGFSGEMKKNANIALMVSLGAEPPKNKRKNYKKLLEDKTKLKKEAELADDKYKVLQSKHKWKSQQSLKRKKKKDVKGLLDVYGEVNKSKKYGKKKKLKSIL